MSYGKGPFSVLAVLLSGLLGACNLWGTNMKATEFFAPDQVELLGAIQQGNETKAREMLARGVELNVHGKEGITPPCSG